MCRLEFASNSIPSLSCLHAIEHVGLGRYGDPIDPEGCFTAMRELQPRRGARRTAVSRHADRQRSLAFNSERIFDPRTIVTALAPLRLASFAAVDDRDRFVANADLGAFAHANYACGLFEFTKD